jgi:DNA repair protein RadC
MKYSALPKEENPKHRIREVGGKALTNAEMLALALFIGDSDQSEKLADLYREYGGLSKIPRHRIMEIKGLGESCADAIQAIVEIVRREISLEKPERPSIHVPADAAELVMYDMRKLEVEQMRVIVLNTKNEVIKISTVVQGSVNSAQIRIGELFREAIRENANAIILVHNHPSGDPTPSPEDVAVTRSAVSAGKNLDIDVLDHLVIGAGRFVSLREKGLGFN